MSQESEMPHLVQQSLEEACELEKKDARANPASKDLYQIGCIEDFEPKELAALPRGCKVFVGYGMVYSHSSQNPPHYLAANIISEVLIEPLKNAYQEMRVHTLTGKGFKVKNENECGAKFEKYPDGVIGFCTEKQEFPFVAIEVGFTHENTDMLLREAEVLLNQHTALNYVLLCDIVADRHNARIATMRFILCKRLPDDELKVKQKAFKEAHSKECLQNKASMEKVKFGGARMSKRILDLATGAVIEDNYQVIIVFDITIEAGNLREFSFLLDDAILLRGTPLEGRHNERRIICFTTEEIRLLMSAALQEQ